MDRSIHQELNFAQIRKPNKKYPHFLQTNDRKVDLFSALFFLVSSYTTPQN